jgi:hypothetical protein
LRRLTCVISWKGHTYLLRRIADLGSAEPPENHTVRLLGVPTLTNQHA